MRYSEHICNYFVISNSWFNGKIYAVKRVLITRGILGFSWIAVFGKDHSKLDTPNNDSIVVEYSNFAAFKYRCKNTFVLALHGFL